MLLQTAFKLVEKTCNEKDKYADHVICSLQNSCQRQRKRLDQHSFEGILLQ